MSATARVDPDFRSEQSTTDAHRTARFGNPPRRPLVIGLLGSLMLLVGGFGAGGVLVRDPIMTNSVIGFWRYGHGHDIAAILMYGGVGLLLWAWIMLGRDVLAHRVGGRAVLTNALVWIGPLLLAPPLFTRDIFSYLAQGALPLHGFDPYAVGPDAMDENARILRGFLARAPGPRTPLELGQQAKVAIGLHRRDVAQPVA